MKIKNYVPDEVKVLAPSFEKQPEWFSLDEYGVLFVPDPLEFDGGLRQNVVGRG